MLKKQTRNLILAILTLLTILTKSAPAGDLVENLFGNLYTKKIYSGYLNTANANRKLHYVYVESQSNPSKDPLVLWLNGGPGCSSLLGLIQEHGPVIIPDYTSEFKLNEFAWNKNANVIYLESPAGVGFSYNDNGDADMKYTDEIVANDNRFALLDFFSKFSELQKNDFYISGESYAGVYVPTLAENIIKNSRSLINLKGIIVGNGLTDLEVDIENALVDFAYGHGLYSQGTRDRFAVNCNSTVLTPECKAARKEIKNSLQGLNIYDVYRECRPSAQSELESAEEDNKHHSLKFLTQKKSITSKYESKIASQQSVMINTLKKLSNKQKLRKLLKTTKIDLSKFKFDLLSLRDFQNELSSLAENDDEDTSLWPDGCADDPFPTQFFNKLETKNKLNVRTNISYVQCNNYINGNYTFGDSLKSYNNTLLNSGIRIWFYSGDTDAAVPFTGAIKWIPKLNMDITEPYRKWIVNGQGAGYVQSYDSLVYVTILGTGHMAPQWKREEAFVMFNAFLKGERLPWK